MNIIAIKPAGGMRSRGNAARIVHDWWRLRRAVAELQDMNDRMLRDIGIKRDEIGQAVRFGRETLS